VIVFGAVLAMAISLIIGSSQSVWFDEAYSILLAKSSFSEIIRLSSIDTHPPLFYIILKIWGMIFGFSELALRSLVVLFFGASVITAGLIVKKLFGTKATLFSLALIILSPILLRYGFEIRMYSMAMFIGALATLVLINAVSLDNSSRKRLYLFVVYGFLVAIGVYTLYYLVLLWMAHFVWLLWRSLKNKDKILNSLWFKSYLFGALLFLPWLPIFLKQVNNGALAQVGQSMTLENLVGVLSFNYLYQPTWQLDKWSSIIMLAVISIVISLSVMAFKMVDKKRLDGLVLLAMYWLVPISLMVVIGLFRPMYVERYLSHIIIGLSMFVGSAVYIIWQKSKSRVCIWLWVFLIGVSLAGTIHLAEIGNFNFQRLQKTEPKTLASLVKCGDGTAVIVDDPYYAVEFSYYLDGCRVYFYSDSDNLGGGYAPISNKGNGTTDMSTIMKQYSNIYHIYYDKSMVLNNLQRKSFELIELNNNLKVEHYSN